MDWLPLVIAFGAGLVSGALNVIAGGGSFLTLPILLFLGLPAAVANASNRVGILSQNIGAVWSFRSRNVLPWRPALAAAAPAALGALLGARLAVEISDEGFRKLLAVLMVGLTLWSLLGPARREPAPGEAPPAPSRGKLALLGLGFFVVGIYGGFVQAGVGFLLLALTSAAGLDLVRGNALKVFCALVFNALSLVVFLAHDLVSWPLALALAAGSFLGGLAGARWTVSKGHQWVRRVVTVAVVAFAIKLWFF